MRTAVNRHWQTKLLISILAILSLAIASVPATTPVQASSTVYVTRTGKHYFYNRHDRGLNRAKHVYSVSLSTAKARHLTLSATESQPVKRHKVVRHKKVVKKPTVRKKVAKKRVTKKKAVHKTVKKASKKAKSAATSISSYHVQTKNHNEATFTKSTLSLKHGAWAKYGNLDGLNRATTANALLNRKLMPSRKREALIVNPTGWHNKKIHGEWLFNRCHLIGYQLTGQNNNLKNLITGTRVLNDPGMTKYENEVAKYLKSNSKHYVRYQVKPVFDGHNLLATGVQMQGESIGSKAVHFNVYLPNTQPGVKINYATGTSRIQ